MRYYDVLNRGVVAALGETVSYDAGGPVYGDLTGVFSADEEVVDGEGQVISTAPMVLIRRSELPDGVIPEADHRVYIPENEKWYSVWEVHEPDPDSWSLLLKRED